MGLRSITKTLILRLYKHSTLQCTLKTLANSRNSLDFFDICTHKRKDQRRLYSRKQPEAQFKGATQLITNSFYSYITSIMRIEALLQNGKQPRRSRHGGSRPLLLETEATHYRTARQVHRWKRVHNSPAHDTQQRTKPYRTFIIVQTSLEHFPQAASRIQGAKCIIL